MREQSLYVLAHTLAHTNTHCSSQWSASPGSPLTDRKPQRERRYLLVWSEPVSALMFFSRLSVYSVLLLVPHTDFSMLSLCVSVFVELTRSKACKCGLFGFFFVSFFSLSPKAKQFLSPALVMAPSSVCGGFLFLPFSPPLPLLPAWKNVHIKSHAHTHTYMGKYRDYGSLLKGRHS